MITTRVIDTCVIGFLSHDVEQRAKEVDFLFIQSDRLSLIGLKDLVQE